MLTIAVVINFLFGGFFRVGLLRIDNLKPLLILLLFVTFDWRLSYMLLQRWIKSNIDHPQHVARFFCSVSRKTVLKVVNLMSW